MKLLYLSLIVTSCQAQQHEVDISRDCDNPDAPVSCCFAGMPSKLTSIAEISDGSKGGEPMVISGVVTRNGKPVQGIIMYAYHTDAKGIYSKNGKEKGVQKWHGQFHGWCKTDEKGRYTLKTIRPAKYPKSNGPAHIHASIQLPEGNSFWMTDFVFKDDPAVNSGYNPPASIPGGPGIVDLQQDSTGTWRGTRNLAL